MPAATETVHAKKRDARGTKACRLLRAEGFVPAILYGHKEETQALQVSREELEETLRHHVRILELAVGRKKESVLLKEVQYDAFGSEIVHVDFVRVAMDERVTLEVSITLKGRPKQEHAVLQQPLGTVEVECLPGDIPDVLFVPVGHLEIGDVVHVREMVAPAGVKILTDGETIVATLTPPAKEEVAEAPIAEAEAGALEPEVIGREKKEGEELPEEPEQPKRNVPPGKKRTEGQ